MTIGAIGSYGYDPYFMAAYQSYNPNFQGAAQASGTTQVPQQDVTTNELTFQGAPRKEEESSGSAAKLIVGGAIAIGTGVMLYKAHKKGGEKGIVEGFKQMWKGITGKTTKDAFKMQKNADGNWFCTISNRNQKIDINTAKNLGINADEVVKFGDKNTQAIAFEFVHDGNKVQVNGNNIVGYFNKDNENILSKLTSEAADDVKYKKELQSIIAKIQKGENTIDNVKINKIFYNHTADGVTRRFVQEGDNVTLNKIITNRHTLDSDAVTAYRRKNANIDETLKEIEKGKVPENGLKIANAECVIDGTRLKIENGEVVGLIEKDGKFRPKESDKFQAWLYKNPEALNKAKEKMKNKELENIIYQVA